MAACRASLSRTAGMPGGRWLPVDPGCPRAEPTPRACDHGTRPPPARGPTPGCLTGATAGPGDQASALRRAAAAHADHEKRSDSGPDGNWPAWYAAYMVAEQAGTDLPA
jgi:hypothetical protein